MAFIVTGFTQFTVNYPQIQTHVNQGVQLTQQVSKLGLTYFGILQSAFLIAYGAKEFFIDRKRAVREQSESLISGKLGKICGAVFGWLLRDNTLVPNYPLMHGALFFSSGVYSSISACHELGFIDLRGALKPVIFCADTLFIAANMAAIKHNCDLYYESFELPDDATPREINLSLQVGKSAAMGIISNFSYILAGLIPILGLPTALAFVFGCVAIATGGLKIVYDLFFLNKT